jgi:prevent-host-death family protein
MNMLEVTVAEFRANTKDVLDMAKSEPIVISRLGERFVLVNAEPEKKLLRIATKKNGDRVVIRT